MKKGIYSVDEVGVAGGRPRCFFCPFYRQCDPARGMKKVLEYYLETLTRTGNTAPTEVILKLQTWKQRKTLAPVIRKIGKLAA